MVELRERGAMTSYGSVWRIVRDVGVKFKKNSVRCRAVSAEDRAVARAMKGVSGRLDPRRLVFIDETWAKTNMTPIRGWAPRGQKPVARALFGKWRTLTVIAALRHDRIDAPCVLDEPINGTSFTAWSSSSLVPTLNPSDIVIMDKPRQPQASSRPKGDPRQTPGSCSSRRTRQTSIRSSQVFAKLKLLLRKAAERSVEAAWRRIGPPLDHFRPHQCAACLRNSRYAST